MIALVMGGSGSGKSAWAEALIARAPRKNRVYIATMRPTADAQARIARHRAQRAGLGFETLECPQDIGSLRLPPDCAALVEDIPNLLANEMYGGGDWRRILPGLEALVRRCGTLVLVTGDVFRDGLTYDESTREYRTRLADINSSLAALADAVIEVVYSIPVPVKGELPCV